jgi:hypothetical protein
MINKQIYLGNKKLQLGKKGVSGAFIEIEGEKYYKISHFNEMPDFFMTIVSDSDHWMYLSSNGSLTAGRKNRNNALFPYYTVDKIHDFRGKTGSKSLCLIEQDSACYLWEPFSAEAEKLYDISRNIYKSIYGNKVIFEEINNDLNVRFRYAWYNSEKYGWIKKSELTNEGKETRKIDILDGLINILPYGVDYGFQSEYSNLLDAYKKNELLLESKLGLFMLSSIPVDRAEPSEALKTTSVWSVGPDCPSKLLVSEKQIPDFIQGMPVQTEVDVRASKGAYLIQSSFLLAEKECKHWYFVAEINQDAKDIADLDHYIRNAKDLEKDIQTDIELGTTELIKIVSSADGLQLGNEELSPARHFSNTLFNVMRGGIFTNSYSIEVSDLELYLKQTNIQIAEKFAIEIKDLPAEMAYADLTEWARMQKDPDLERICTEYLPLTFSRRHGDPSRPWNQFSIELKNEDGSKKLNYQGNWRDIFQNWEALCLSYPDYVEGMISKFVNATTPDGYNPYRITREGIDWESPHPNDPWAYIGYWGDHQIIYLQKFLEHSEAFHPGKIDELLTKNVFVYANVPYRIKDFKEIVKDPKDTILFDHNLNHQLEDKVKETGADGKLLRNKKGQLVRANLTEKMMVSLLAKLSNFIPEAGIWLNTQRPEWNDANNALVGNGVSMVTLYYIRRCLVFWKKKFSHLSVEHIELSETIQKHFDSTFEIFKQFQNNLNSGFSDQDRFEITKALGEAGGNYRKEIYELSFLGNGKQVSTKKLTEFCNLALKYIDQSVAANKRTDGLFHAYNLISFSGDNIKIRYLYEMLEGQVAFLSSGYATTEGSLQVLDALKSSKMFRQDQFSYLLYPDRQLPRFTEKNNIPNNKISEIGLLTKLVEDRNTSIIVQDITGNLHFNASFRNGMMLEKALETLKDGTYKEWVERDGEKVLRLYESIFDHQSFTGRSGTFYGYEGLGSIYWHMVSKLLQATQEVYFRGIEKGADSDILNRIKDHYYEIKAGIGLYKSPDIYGAFPTDAYSHTPANAGVKQPGLTGQVKEDVISRIFELGIQIKQGQICFDPTLLNGNELLKKQANFVYYDLSGAQKQLSLDADQIGFTFCQVPIIFNFGKQQKIRIAFENGEIREISGAVIPIDISNKIFNRNKEVKWVEYSFQ